MAFQTVISLMTMGIINIFRINKKRDNKCNIICNSLTEFYNLVNNTNAYDDKSLYYYKGDANTLYDLFQTKYNDEYDIDSSLLEYLEIESYNKTNVLFSEAMFFTDRIEDLKLNHETPI